MSSARIKTTLLLFMLASGISTQAAILEVNGPGGLFSNISAAVNASSDYDTVLVYPGLYYENIMLTRPVTLASLNMTTGNPAYIDSTIIDAQGNNSCIIIGLPVKKVIWGFTIRNGGGNDYGYGGGIYANQTDLDLINCKLSRNSSSEIGGGIYAYHSNIFLINSILDSNQTKGDGGGLYMNHGNLSLQGCKITHNQGCRGGGLFVYDAGLAFDTLEGSSIYENFGYFGCDIYLLRSRQEPIEIIIDTFSLPEADSYTFSRDEGVMVIVRHGRHQPVDGHIYVSPNGSNENSGTSLSEPLQSLWLAMLKIRTDSLHPGTIHLFPGTFSPTQTGEHFPMGMRDYITLKGARKEETIIDGDSLSHVFQFSGRKNVVIRDLTMQRGKGTRHPNEGMIPGLMEIMRCHFLKFSNVAFRRNFSSFAPVAYVYACDSLVFDSSEVYDNHGGCALYIVYSEYSNPRPRTVIIRNSSFHHNLDQNGYYYGNGGSIALSGYEDDTAENRIEITNCEFHHNESKYHVTAYSPSDPAIHLDGNGIVNITNCNFSDNYGQTWYYTISLRDRVKAEIYNSIFYANEPEDIYIGNSDPFNPDYEYDLELHHSLLEDGEASLKVWDTLSKIYYSSANILGDPLFKWTGDYPYQLLQQSPCINAGTLNLPSGIFLPEVDLSGNPRIFSDLVDIGAYEYNEFVKIDENEGLTEDDIRISAFPNPFTTSIEFSFELEEDESALVILSTMTGIAISSWEIDYYDGSYTWDGRDWSGNLLPAGIYILKAYVDSGRNASRLIVKNH